MKKITRRQFLKGVGQCAALAAVAPVASLMPVPEPVVTVDPWYQMGFEFVNGIVDGTNKLPGLRPFWPMPDDSLMTGRVAEVKVWDRALTEKELVQESRVHFSEPFEIPVVDEPSPGFTLGAWFFWTVDGEIRMQWLPPTAAYELEG